ncbi:hemolysin family protein [Pleomorphomonas sp. JP5]|uniref:hemolysin family protein n=1 Tax=Pleomorphomonas sp. JP5 TaxID=2942998 RepID=UPI002043BD83|nr:hemolysin family protein [Pleomorphomonas sp. JP5]MCM5557779.1 hemolysin family protein [Pleomorphomonas sp. JP5]
MGYLFEIGVIFILLILNGLFAMSELAVVSSRRPRLEAMASRGSKGAATVLKLAANPGRFLSSVQIGITLVGILAGAYSGATLSEPFAEFLLAEGVPASFASALSIAVVVGLITYFSLVIGELVPKQIALSNPEAVASLMARPMLGVAFIAAPLVFVLERSSRLIIGVLGLKATGESTVTEEEIKAVIAEGTNSGILEPEEKELMAGVMRFSDRSIRAVMIPRPDITGIDLDWDDRRIIEAIATSSHSRYPVFTGEIDMVQGVIQAKDLLDQHLKGEPLDIRSRIRQVDMVPDTASALDVLDTLRRSPLQMVMVIDEYGSVEGMVTAADILTAIVGNLGGEADEEVSEIVQRADGSWLIDADLGVDLVAEKIDCRGLDDPERDYETLAGFVLSVTKAIPSTGDIVDWRGWRFEIVDMDGRRIDKVLVTAPAQPQG